MRGPQVRYRIKSSIDALDREARDLRATRELTANKMNELAEMRERLFRSLTQVYLPELGQQAIDQVKQRLPVVHRRLDAVMRAKQQELHRLDVGRDESGVLRAKRVEQLDAVTGRIEEAAVERDRLSETVGATLAGDPRHAELAQTVEQTRVRREQAERRYDTAMREKEEKVPAYESDPLFGYLLRRQYGTERYNPSRPARVLDGWVADKVGYARQVESYRLLLELPAVAQAELAENDAAYEQAAERLRDLEKSIENLHGLTQVVERGQRLYAQRQALVSEIEEIDGTIQQVTRRLAELESTRGPYYEEARDALSEFLESKPIPQLREIALGTATRKDDRLADELAHWESEWEAVRAQLAKVERSERERAVRLDELRKVENRFRSKDFDASNSTFAQDFDFEKLLKAFLIGSLTVRQLWKAIASSQRFEPTEFQKAGPVVEAILWEVLRAATRGGRRGGWGGGSWGGGGWGGGGGTTGGFGGFGGGSSTTGGFG